MISLALKSFWFIAADPHRERVQFMTPPVVELVDNRGRARYATV